MLAAEPSNVLLSRALPKLSQAMLAAEPSDACRSGVLCLSLSRAMPVAELSMLAELRNACRGAERCVAPSTALSTLSWAKSAAKLSDVWH